MADRTYGGRSVADRSAARRRQFLDAALEEFSTAGYAASSVTSICRTAALSRRQFYELFVDREALLIALYDEIQQGARDAVANALSASDSDDRRHLVTVAMRAFMASVVSDPRRAEVAFVQIVGVSPAVESHRLDDREVWVGFFTAAMAEYAHRTPTDRDDDLAIAFVGALTSVIHRWSTDPAPDRVDAIVDLLADILLSFITL
ncbi:TetR/AcrR family transcriptional regulator [Gordonia sp. VNQ95]|jgi:AcrR family transcriptional regulator|uniref:TetR/AcrR family transcriptional regulator n=1 Tax=Gordonia sp. VNQ95 TaxID=3156619 RepID=UPI0032B343C8